MAVQSFINDLLFTRSEILSNYTQDYLDHFSPMNEVDLKSGTLFNFRIQERKGSSKINPIIRQATIYDIEDIIFTYKDVYEESYPYKEMEDPDFIEKMLERDDVEWFIFIDPQTGEMCGSFTFMLNFKEKIGYARGLVVKKKFIGRFDILKACIGCYIFNYTKYNGVIFRWYSENRTAHAKVQYVTRHSGFHPVAFYPNKDNFFGKIESDILALCYDVRAISDLRSKKKPCIIPEAIKIFQYANKRYDLGNFEIYLSMPNIDVDEIRMLTSFLKIETFRDSFGYEEFKISIEGRDSYITFLHTPSVKNIEKTRYKISNINDLIVLAKELMNLSKVLDVRYIEIFISAYEPEHQKIFYELGLDPRGYVPSWKYEDTKKYFEDYIVFNKYRGKIDDEIKLLDEEKELIKCINLK